MLDVIAKRGLPLDRITTVDIWATDTIRGELPEMVEFKKKADQFIWNKYHIEVEHFCAMQNGEKLTYEKLFYHVPKRHALSAKYSGMYQGFPVRRGAWCQNLKHRLVPELVNEKRKGNVVEYIGIAADEPKRFGQLSDHLRAPLVEYGIDEGLCGLYCQYAEILSPSYKTSCRDGCWMCHNQGVDQLRQLRKRHPELWELLLKWDGDSPVVFYAGRKTVHDFDRRFGLEDDGFLAPSDTKFRWDSLDKELQRRLF